jgi:hypothetical protein
MGALPTLALAVWVLCVWIVGRKEKGTISAGEGEGGDVRGVGVKLTD